MLSAVRSVGEFRRADAPALTAVTQRRAPVSLRWSGSPGTAKEEVVTGAVSNLEILARLRRELEPAHYLETGVRHGPSLALARGLATGVDPPPALDRDTPPTTRVVPLTSDEFFAELPSGITPDLRFIERMHTLRVCSARFYEFRTPRSTWCNRGHRRHLPEPPSASRTRAPDACVDRRCLAAREGVATLSARPPPVAPRCSSCRAPFGGRALTRRTACCGMPTTPKCAMPVSAAATAARN